jgi:cation diffusion facilitator CzcD-associated flavoprotein CzcO
MKTVKSTLDLVIVGAGFAGMYMLHRAKKMGLKALVLEAGDGVGGTWYWNRYPGARCDIDSTEYSYQFSEELQQEWEWTERYAAQPEILRYANHVADRFQLRPDIQFQARVSDAQWSQELQQWSVETRNGDVFNARFLVLATGCLSSANMPSFLGQDEFQGDLYHTGQWPHEPVSFAGKRVGVIGTGSSGVQSIPVIAQQAAQVVVFQRTATYSVPAHNGPIDPVKVASIKANYKEFRAKNSLMHAAFGSATPRNEKSALEVSEQERQAEFERRWKDGGLPFAGAFNDLLLLQEANDYAAAFVRNKISEKVNDATTAQLLSPTQVLGCKRICVDSGYYETFNRDNVALVDISQTPISALTATGIQVGKQHYDLDCLVFATGFDAMTGSLLKINPKGRDGLALQEAWHAGPRTYLGLGVHGFPNMFTISGPGSPSVLTNMLVSIEQHVNWIADCLAHMQSNALATIEAQASEQERWVEHVNSIAGKTLYPSCNSWYLGANVPGKNRVFMPLSGFPDYVKRCEKVVANGYEGFQFAT